MRRYDGIVGRIIDAVNKGNVDFLKILYGCGLLKAYDTFDLTGRNHHGYDNDSQSILHIVARDRCPNFDDLIDLMISVNVDINAVYGEGSPLDVAINYENFPTAAYLESKGALHNSGWVNEESLAKYEEWKAIVQPA
jgi:hypothetical protein